MYRLHVCTFTTFWVPQHIDNEENDPEEPWQQREATETQVIDKMDTRSIKERGVSGIPPQQVLYECRSKSSTMDTNVEDDGLECRPNEWIRGVSIELFGWDLAILLAFL